MEATCKTPPLPHCPITKEGPYRTADDLLLCTRCNNPAGFRCLGCGSLSCLDHFWGEELCPDCRLRLASEQRRAASPTLGVSAGVVLLGAGSLLSLP